MRRVSQVVAAPLQRLTVKMECPPGTRVALGNGRVLRYDTTPSHAASCGGSRCALDPPYDSESGLRGLTSNVIPFPQRTALSPEARKALLWFAVTV